MDGRPNLFARGGAAGDRLDEWLAAARADEAARTRSRQGFLHRTASEDATFAGVLLDLAESGRSVLVTGTSGRRHRGSLLAVGTDVAVLGTAEGHRVLLAHRGIAVIRADGRASAGDGDREVVLAATLGEVLAVVAEDGPRVLVVTTAGGEGTAGDLRSVGRDVVVLRLDGAERRTAYVALGAVAEVTLA